MSQGEQAKAQGGSKQAVTAAVLGFVVVLGASLGLIAWWNDDADATPPPVLNFDAGDTAMISNHITD
ncbi:MAG: hypothetical protein KDB86_06910 [Actinobacteria bacterium]|nr:hypothetical protein [Actinomycetota bacterium]